MKRVKNNKVVFLLVALVAATIIGTLTFSNFESKDELPNTSSIKKTDAQFLARAAEIDLQEIQLGQLAQQKGIAMDAKELGRAMEKEHTQLLSDLTALAKKKGIALPKTATHEAMEEYNELNNKSERRFNEEYCELVIKEHKEAVSLFEKASKEASDPEIREWAETTIPALKTHLANAKLCKEKCEKM